MRLRGEHGLNLRVCDVTKKIKTLSEFNSAMRGNWTPPEAEESERSVDFLMNWLFYLKWWGFSVGKGVHGSGWRPKVLNPSPSMPGLKQLPLWSPCEVPVPSGHSCCPRLWMILNFKSKGTWLRQVIWGEKIIWTSTIKGHCCKFQQLSQILWGWVHRSSLPGRKLGDNTEAVCQHSCECF